MKAMGTAPPMQRKPANAKRGLTARLRARKRAKQISAEIAIKAQVLIRDGYVCRVCGRQAESVHEIKSKGAGGAVSLENSIAVCGLLVGASPSCHTYLQRKEIGVAALLYTLDANLPLVFLRLTDAARKWIASAKA